MISHLLICYQNHFPTRFTWVLCALLLLVFNPMGVLAQTREDDIPYVPFAVTGGRAVKLVSFSTQ
jgi:hypothetical protein